VGDEGGQGTEAGSSRQHDEHSDHGHRTNVRRGV
jgi:hypothetical protein